MPEGTREVIGEVYHMATGASQTTISRKEQYRIREGILIGTTHSSGDTRVYIKGIKDPIMISFSCIIEAATDSWQGIDYDKGSDFATVGYNVVWDGPNHGTSGNRNSFLIRNIESAQLSANYRLWFKYLEKI